MSSAVLTYIGLGCNLGERLANLSSALQAIKALPDCKEVVCSSVYETEPMGPSDQPDFLNAVVSMQTQLDAHELLLNLQHIEDIHGRERKGERWGPRTLDLDILLYGDDIIETETLRVPHPGIAERSFVLLPLQELAPELMIPGVGKVASLVAQCRQFGIRRLNSTL